MKTNKKIYGREVLRFVRIERGENPLLFGALLAVVDEKYKHPLQSAKDPRRNLQCLRPDGTLVTIDPDNVSPVPSSFVVVHNTGWFNYLWEADPR